MSDHYPKIRIYAGFGSPMAREGLSLDFFLRLPHSESAQAVLHALETFLRAVGHETLGWYADADGEFHELDDAGWALVRRELQQSRGPIIRLYDAPDGLAYRFEYYGKSLDPHPLHDKRNASCAMNFWLPTELLEARGPFHLRELALELAASLPFYSGYMGLSFNGELDVVGVGEEVVPYCFRHPGIGITDLSTLGWEMGSRFRGPAWLTFLGQPLLGQVGSATLRSRLHSPGTTVQELAGDKVCITLGEWPEAGDTDHGDNLPAYRELARVMEPWLFHNPYGPMPSFSDEEKLRWERRFLD